MDKLTSDIKNIENNIAKYIYIKYIQNSNIDSEFNSSSVIDNDLYKTYLKTIFQGQRQSRITQHETLINDLNEMKFADTVYNIKGDNYNIHDFNSLPDILRCTYIRKIKHRYYRCKNHVCDNDSDVCKKHKNIENIYFDKYNDLIQKIN